METLIKLNSQTAGRDKIARFVQYLSRFLWHRLQHRDINRVNNFKNLEFQLSTFRKLLRFGRCVDSFYSIYNVISHPDPTVKFTITLSKICNALFLLADHFLWLGRADICKVNTDKWANLSNKYWLYAITVNLLRDLHEISVLLKDEKFRILPVHGIKSINDLLSMFWRLYFILNARRDVMIDTIKNVCDFFIPLNALGHVNLSPGTIGFLGMISSIAGLIILIEPKAKLTPA